MTTNFLNDYYVDITVITVITLMAREIEKYIILLSFPNTSAWERKRSYARRVAMGIERERSSGRREFGENSVLQGKAINDLLCRL